MIGLVFMIAALASTAQAGEEAPQSEARTRVRSEVETSGPMPAEPGLTESDKPAEPGDESAESEPSGKPSEPESAPTPAGGPVGPAAKPASQPTRPVGVARRERLRRSGYFGWGLGLEAPMFGVMTAIAQRSDPGWGYWLGGALSWEASPRFLIRLYVATGQTYGGKAGVRYIGNVQTGELTRSGQAAELVGLDAGLGGAYLFRSLGSAWTPLVGVDLGYSFYGYYYSFDDSLEEIEAVDVGDAFRQCVDAACRSDQHDGMMFGPTFTLRSGVRLELTRWLASRAELALTYVSLREERISNTVESRNVTTAAESLLMVRMLFTVRLGL